MKTQLTRYTCLALLASAAVVSCDLDEGINYASASLETAYSSADNYQGLINSCYEQIYYLYGKVDGIGAMEMGTDLWTTEKVDLGLTWYGADLSTSAGTLVKFWQGLYGTVNLCNTAIAYADAVKGLKPNEVNAMVAEAHFLRAWAHFHIVEQWGNCVLNTGTVALNGIPSSATRTDETAFYDLMIDDLEFAKANLPINQVEIGRASKKAALAMLTKVYLQRTRLGDEQKYSQLALENARELIDNQQKYGCALYTSDAETSGYEKLWDAENNKTNTEFVFLEYVDHENAANPEGWNRGRTMQKYEYNESLAATFGITNKSFRYGRGNDRGWKPTLYLLTKVYDPHEDTPDMRFKTSFHYKYYATQDKVLTADLCNTAHINPALAGHTIKGTGVKGSGDEAKAVNYYASIGWMTGQWIEGLINMDNDEGLAIYTPNWNIDPEVKYNMPCLTNDPQAMFGPDGKYVKDDAYRYQLHPSLKKFSPVKWMYNNGQYNMGNFPIIRLGDVYLLAAEAAIRLGDKQTALKYVQPIRERAAVTGRAAEMRVSESDMTLDFIVAERGRELAGEQWRWYDLKRLGKLNREYLSMTNPDTDFDNNKNMVRPIPQSFLDQIANPDEFGSNGY